MNPLVKKTVEKLNYDGKMTEGDKMHATVIIGNAIIEVLDAAKQNPNYNLNGCGYINENTIGNYDVPNAT